MRRAGGGALVAARGDTSAQAVDHLLWNRGAGARYKAHPRPRARTTAYQREGFIRPPGWGP